MRNLRKIAALLLAAVMMAGMLVVPGGNVQAAKKVQLNKKTVTLEVGKKVTLKLKNAPKKKITWSSNKKKIASVNKKGVVTAKKAGKANITAKVSGKKYVCKVTVKKKETPVNSNTNTTPTNPAPVNVKVSKLEWSGGSNREDMNISEKVTVSVVVSPENASNKNIEWSVESGSWDEEPGDVIELTPHGLSADINAIGKGYATIFAKSTDGSNLKIRYDIFVSWAKIYITTSNVEYEGIVNNVDYDDSYLMYRFRNLGLCGDVPWEKLKNTLSFSVPDGYTMTYTDYTDPDCVYTKGYFQIKNSAGKMVDDFYLTYYVNDLKAGYKNDNSQVECREIDTADDYWVMYFEGDVPWSEVDKEQLHFTCDKAGFEAVPEWKTNALGSDVGYVYLKGIGEKTPCAKYNVFYNNRETEIDSIQCKNEDDLKFYNYNLGTYNNDIWLYSCKSWDDIKDELEYYGNGEQFSISYGEVNPEDQGYVVVLNIKEGDSIVRKYKIHYMQLPTISYNPQYGDLGISAIDIIYGSNVCVYIYTSEQLDLQTVIKQLNFTCVDHPSYGFAELDGSDGGGDMYICDGDDYICNIYFRLIQE